MHFLRLQRWGSGRRFNGHWCFVGQSPYMGAPRTGIKSWKWRRYYSCSSLLSIWVFRRNMICLSPFNNSKPISFLVIIQESWFHHSMHTGFICICLWPRIGATFVDSNARKEGHSAASSVTSICAWFVTQREIPSRWRASSGETREFEKKIHWPVINTSGSIMHVDVSIWYLGINHLRKNTHILGENLWCFWHCWDIAFTLGSFRNLTHTKKNKKRWPSLYLRCIIDFGIGRRALSLVWTEWKIFAVAILALMSYDGINLWIPTLQVSERRVRVPALHHQRERTHAPHPHMLTWKRMLFRYILKYDAQIFF